MAGNETGKIPSSLTRLNNTTVSHYIFGRNFETLARWLKMTNVRWDTDFEVIGRGRRPSFGGQAPKGIGPESPKET